MRMLAGVLAGQPFSSTLVGDASLSARPMRRVMEPLERMGARLDATEGHAPLTIQGASLHAWEGNWGDPARGPSRRIAKR